MKDLENLWSVHKIAEKCENYTAEKSYESLLGRWFDLATINGYVKVLHLDSISYFLPMSPFSTLTIAHHLSVQNKLPLTQIATNGTNTISLVCL